ncbi:MAG: low-specificity L-threonine aldolase [Anaerolineae bacterium]
MKTIDLRSDTVTWPTEKMRQAMANAEVGDDVYGEDPTVIQLEQESAELLGKEAGLLVSSGTQGNLISVLTHCGRGDEVILGDKSHTFVYEAGGIAVLGGVQPHTVPVHEDGTMDIARIRQAIRGDNYHFPRTKLIALENTQGTVGGVPVTKAYTDDVAALAHEHGLKLHVDGARFFNAAAALGISAKQLMENTDTMTFCLSKGLCAPVGSMIVGDADFIKEARRIRKLVGGGMRQAGVIAAAGLIAIREMVERLPEDHENACLLGESLSEIDGLQVKSMHTNFVFFDLLPEAKLTPQELMARLKQEHNIVLSLYPGYTHTFRAVTHYWIKREHIPQIANALKTLLN